MDKPTKIRIASVFILGISLLFVLAVQPWRKEPKTAVRGQNTSGLPVILNGELVLPDITAGSGTSPLLLNKARLGVVSANLVPVFDQQANRVVALRVIGETSNLGSRIVNGMSPVVRFLGKDNKAVAQKIGHDSANYTLFDLPPGETTLYDITVDDPPAAEKLEIVLNASSATDSAIFEQLKIASRSMEMKTAVAQNNSTTQTNNVPESSESSVPAATATLTPTPVPAKVEYFRISGYVVNTFADPISEVTVYGWVKNKENKIYSVAHQVFKNDLLAPQDKLPFSLLLLPLRDNEEFGSYEIGGWGKKYSLLP